MSIIDKLGRLFTKTSDPTRSSPQPASPAVAPVDFNYADERIPSGAQERARRIIACLHEVEGIIARETIPDFSRYELEQMRDQHLPKLIRSYIDIPAAHRSEIFRKTGKSASFILSESLDQMQSRIDDILRNLAQNDIDAFTNNIQFIGQRYADGDPFK